MSNLLNHYEKVTYEHLKPICDRNGATVFAKVRLKDALPIENSGVTGPEYRFALQSHFDFLVVDAETKPLFAVEYDGRQHGDQRQVERDRVKNALCERFDFGLLRIRSNHIVRKFRGLDLLTYFIEVWFMHDAFYAAQRDGLVPLDEDFDPWLVAHDGRSEKSFPFWLSADAQIALQRLYNEGRITEPIPSDYIGIDSENNYRALAWIEISDGQFAAISTGMRAQNFPIVVSDLLSQIAICDLHSRVLAVIDGGARTVPAATFESTLREFERKYEMRQRCGVSRSPERPS